MLTTLPHEYRTKGNATKVVSTVHPDDINEKFNFLGIVAEKNFHRVFSIKKLKFYYSKSFNIKKIFKNNGN